MTNGQLESSEDTIRLELEKEYKDNPDKDNVIETAMNYIRQELTKQGKSIRGSETVPEDAATDNPPESSQRNTVTTTEGGTNYTGLIIGGILAAGAAGGAYVYYANRKKKQQAAQRLAQKRAAQIRSQQGGNGTGRPQQSHVSAQQAARVRTGTYTGNAGKPVPTPSAPKTTGASGNYGRSVDNPYGRYVSGSEQGTRNTGAYKPGEQSRTAGAAKPDEAVRSSSAGTQNRRRTPRNPEQQG